MSNLLLSTPIAFKGEPFLIEEREVCHVYTTNRINSTNREQQIAQVINNLVHLNPSITREECEKMVGIINRTHNSHPLNEKELSLILDTTWSLINSSGPKPSYSTRKIHINRDMITDRDVRKKLMTRLVSFFRRGDYHTFQGQEAIEDIRTSYKTKYGKNLI